MKEIPTEDQPRYEHGPKCVPKDDLQPTASVYILTCVGCAGLFRADTKEGLLIMDRRIV